MTSENRVQNAKILQDHTKAIEAHNNVLYNNHVNLVYVLWEVSCAMTILYAKMAKKQTPPPAFGGALRLVYIGYNDREETLMPSAFHRHEHNLELQLICRGRGHIRIGSRMYDVQRGDVLVYNQGVLHDESADPATGLWFYNCGIKGLQLEGLPENCLLPDTASPLLHTGNLMPTLRSLFRILYGQVQHRYAGNDVVVRSVVEVLLQIILYQIPHEPLAPQREKDRLFIALKDYIDRHFMEELYIETLSTRVHMSMSGLSHQFKKRFGFAPIQYIIRRRIGEAQSILVSTDLSITEVSTRVGFDNVSYFTNQFKKFTGLSPQSYRKYKVDPSQHKQLGEIAAQERQR